MRNCFFLLLLLCSHGFARQNPYFYIKPISFTYSVPLGGLTGNGSSPFVAGTAGSAGFGFEGSLTMVTAARGWGFGIGYQTVAYKHDPAITEKWLYDMYHQDGYYTKVTTRSNSKINITNVSVQLSKEFNFRYLAVAPFVHIGLGVFNGLPAMNVHRKKMNDNYAEDIRLFGEDGSGGPVFFSPKVGLTVGKCVYKPFYVTANLAYGFARVNYRTQEDRSNFLGNSTRNELVYKHPVSNLSASIGIEVRFRRKLSAEEKIRYKVDQDQ